MTDVYDIENITWDEIRLQQSASYTHKITREDVELIAKVSGDLNPTHLDFTYGETHGGLVAHRVVANLLVSGVVGNKLPGPGTSFYSLHLDWNDQQPILIGDIITTTVTVFAKKSDNHVRMDVTLINQNNVEVAKGTTTVIAPTEKIRCKSIELPGVRVLRHDGQQHLLDTAKALKPVTVAVVHPCDKDSLQSALDAWSEGIIIPIIVGNENIIRNVAEQNNLNLGDLKIVNASHSLEAAEKAVSMVHKGEVIALMKGSLHTDELMGAVVKKDGGLRTRHRISHGFIMYPPSYHKMLIITDAAINIAPDLEAKADICQNAINLAIALGVKHPKVAILSAVETINPKMQSTLDAAALCKMADRGQITGGVLDGPLAFDNAISSEAAKIKKITSSVAGDPDILLAPNLEAGNMIAKQLSFLADSDAAGIVLGAKVPIILTSRADSVATRLASCAVGAILANHNRNI